MIESPKKRFLKNQPAARKVADITADPAVILALDAAILQMTWEQGTAKDSQTAAAVHWQLTGAHKLRELFLTIALPDKTPARPRSDNLPHEV
jgi:hypothetical protein